MFYNRGGNLSPPPHPHPIIKRNPPVKKNTFEVLVFAILFLFFVQMAGTLVESIYVLDLMNTTLDEKVLGLLFFFAPLLLLLIRKKIPLYLPWILFALIFLGRGLTPYLDTAGRLLSSGLGASAVLLLFALILSAQNDDNPRRPTPLSVAAGLALAVGLSTLLRTINSSLDYSLTPIGSWVGWVLVILLGCGLTQFKWDKPILPRPRPQGLAPAILGIMLILTLVYFVFSAPAVISRWTESSYPLIVTVVSLLALAWAWVALFKPRWFEHLSTRWLLVWNSAFTLCLTGTILAQRVSFPPTSQSSPVVVAGPTWFQQVPLVLMIILFPVIFIDLHLLVKRVQELNPTPSSLVPGFLLGGLALILLVFIDILTNVWCYIDPISPLFRNLYWLPFLLITAALSLIVYFAGRAGYGPVREFSMDGAPAWTIVLVFIFLCTVAGAWYPYSNQPAPANKNTLRIMTYNIQQANDANAQRSYERQLDNIRQVAPDVIALQESDSARISLNNDDYVRYYADHLGYYSYYGPTTVTGTYGTAILSKYPLLDTRAVFSYSDTDEIGTSEALIQIGSHTFNLYDLHPDGTATAKMTCVETLISRSRDNPYMIAMGDFNVDDNDPVYQRLAGVYQDAWASLNPTPTASGSGNSYGKERIDHIFLSPLLRARRAFYLPPPQSASDHPLHWADVYWEQ